ASVLGIIFARHNGGWGNCLHKVTKWSEILLTKVPKAMVQAAATVPSLKVVVVEDDATIRMFLKECLEKIGHQVIGEADTGTDMARMVLTLAPDIVVFDTPLPHLDGLKALAQIYQEKIVAAVAITADRDQDLVRRAIEEHVLAYLVKPVEAYQLGP